MAASSSRSSPDLDLVVVITSDASQNRNDAGDLVGQVITPAVTD